MNDIVEPLGVKYRNPLPLLLYHDSHQPVGTVSFDKPTKEGITFTAKIANITEPGTLQARVNEAWQSVKAKLLRGVSIGFRPIETAFLDTGGIHFLKTEVLELSLVAIPAHADATIATIKSFDRDRPAALGTTVDRRNPSGVSEYRASGRTGRPMNISAKIAAIEAERRPKALKMTELMEPVLEGDGNLDADQKKEYDTLAAEVTAHDEDIARLRTLETAQAQQAKPIVAKSVAEGAMSRSHAGAVEVKEPELPPGIEFTRYVICKMAARMFGVSPVEVAKARYPHNGRIQQVLKAAVAGATTTDSTWASPLVATPTTLAGEFLEYLRPLTIIGRIPNLNRVPFNVRVQSQTSGGSANWVGEGKQKPVTKFDYDDVTLTWAKVAAIAVLSEELIRFSSPSAEARVRDALTRAIVERLDIDFIDPDKAAVANVSPASITNGIAALSSSGNDADAVRADVATLMGTFISANMDPTNLVWIMSNTTALALSLMKNALGNREFADVNVRGGMFEGFPVVASQYANLVGSPSNNIVILAKADDIFVSDDGGVDVRASDQASIEMSSDPENESGTTVSMYQTNQVALRAERYINWARGRAQAVAWMNSVGWSAS